MRHLSPLAFSMLATALGVGLPCEARGGFAQPLRVTGRAVLSGTLSAVDDGIAVRASLRDEAGRPLGAARVTLRAFEGKKPILPLIPAACPDAAPPPPGAAALLTNDAGDACAILPVASAERVLLSYRDPRHLLKNAPISLRLDRSRRAVRLRFAPRPNHLNLDRTQTTISVAADIAPESPPLNDPLLVELSLKEPGGKALALAQLPIRPGDRGDFVIQAEQLGSPGPAELSAAFSGSAEAQPETRSIRVSRVVTAELALDVEPSEVSPEDGFELRVSVASTAGVVPTGTVEAQLSQRTVGIATVANGVATIQIHYERAGATSPPLTLRYLPDAPWYRSGSPLSVNLKLKPPSRLRQLPWIAAVLLAALWVLSAWRRPPRRATKASVHAKPPAGRPLLELLEPSPTGKGWSGTVVDAHDGSAIAGAQLALVEPGFEKVRVLASTRTDEAGRFELAEPSDPGAGMRLEVAALWHSSLVRAAPRRGQIVVQLVHRRRALLSRLVHWAKSRGWRKHGDPTPGLLARTAHEKNREDVAQWARLVERAAYGPEPPTEQQERAISDNEPR